MIAVAATMAEDVSTAIGIGTPQTNTINGILNDPQEIPAAPPAKPASAVMGSVSHRLTT
jgi:polysaccharide deacetylase 2 family uncharacterized protein YibQ